MSESDEAVERLTEAMTVSGRLFVSDTADLRTLLTERTRHIAALVGLSATVTDYLDVGKGEDAQSFFAALCTALDIARAALNPTVEKQ